MPNPRTLCFDFDGVLHSYHSGWKGATEIPDPPVPGMVEAILRLQSLGWTVVVCSSRARHEGGPEAMREWLVAHGFGALPVTAEKVPAELYVDDRALRFSGSVPEMLEAIDQWRGPWNRGEQMPGQR